jgi:hypothetical protein
MGRYSRRYAATSFGWEEHTTALLALYDEVLPGSADDRDRARVGAV